MIFAHQRDTLSFVDETFAGMPGNQLQDLPTKPSGS